MTVKNIVDWRSAENPEEHYDPVIGSEVRWNGMFRPLVDGRPLLGYPNDFPSAVAAMECARQAIATGDRMVSVWWVADGGKSWQVRVSCGHTYSDMAERFSGRPDARFRFVRMESIVLPALAA